MKTFAAPRQTMDGHSASCKSVHGPVHLYEWIVDYDFVFETFGPERQNRSAQRIHIQICKVTKKKIDFVKQICSLNYPRF